MNKIELSNELMNISVALEKAMVTKNDLSENYFVEAEPEPTMLMHCYDEASIKCHIIGDYLLTAKEKINSILEMLE